MTSQRRLSKRVKHATGEPEEKRAPAQEDSWAKLQGSIGNAAVARLVAGRDKASGEPPMPVDASTQGRIEAQQGSGASLEPAVEEQMEASLGIELPEVTLHRDAEADSLARGLGARAFTQGSDVFLRNDTDPATARGEATLAHELTHVAEGTAVAGAVQRDDDDEEDWAGMMKRYQNMFGGGSADSAVKDATTAVTAAGAAAAGGAAGAAKQADDPWASGPSQAPDPNAPKVHGDEVVSAVGGLVKDVVGGVGSMLGFGPDEPKKQDPMMAALWKETAVLPITRAGVILSQDKPDYATAYEYLGRASQTIYGVYASTQSEVGEEVYNMSLRVDESMAELSPYAKEVAEPAEVADRISTVTSQLGASSSFLYQADATDDSKKMMDSMLQTGIIAPAQQAAEELVKGKPNFARAETLVRDAHQSLTSITRSAPPEHQVELAGFGEQFMVITRQLYALMGKRAPVARIAGDLEVLAINAEELGRRL